MMLRGLRSLTSSLDPQYPISFSHLLMDQFYSKPHRLFYLFIWDCLQILSLKMSLS
uniref:Uncharacterized protein n=1 Tax=Lepeophtheirus salmonis TaxID=72036 RepID=A0A0K2VCN6_LEPSM